ncbi:hypothetical protein [Rhizobium glycinendophyticum]|uniref:Uncharacterized protein n=1 Tax=Rhizobium glycinendophyticum TaxID=2589807 RepID=A0A504UBF1_9HYPH|nr:hypothetical protein [Rhizobium glycinendophyticum]TPP06966.1 hypothetical protein FJQ55_14955 [Rhizobium glycinendophyticum]
MTDGTGSVSKPEPSTEMSFAELAIGNLHIRENDAFAFFAIYARYEYAAKVCQLVHKGPDRRDLTVNPQLVADKAREEFWRRVEKTPQLAEAVDYYIRNPPKKQVWDGTSGAWTEPDYQGADKLKILLLQLGQARNNLFHGGKGWKPDTPECDRDNDLIRHGLIILEAVIRSDEILFHEFSSFQ